MTSIVLPELPAEDLLRSAKTACFAIGADPGEIPVDVVCRRMVEAMVKGQASEAAWRVAQVVAAAAGRYTVLCEAMDQAKLKPPLTDDLVRYGIDVGYRRGRRRGLEQGQVEGQRQGRVEGRRQGRSEGLALGLRRALLATYAARFGEAPPDVVAAVEATREPETLLAWQAVFSTQAAAAVAATVLPRGRRRAAQRAGRPATRR